MPRHHFVQQPDAATAGVTGAGAQAEVAGGHSALTASQPSQPVPQQLSQQTASQHAPTSQHEPPTQQSGPQQQSQPTVGEPHAAAAKMAERRNIMKAAS
ncbi:MAG: hypothetical protein KF705_06030 [Phycisphaeraceae bacterium]|nr:hypothetical protein [Phycisphaeraceae bacterium]